jgi:hypothetical protein
MGGALGGWLVKSAGPQGLFIACAVGMVLWLLVAWPMQAPALRQVAAAAKAG